MTDALQLVAAGPRKVDQEQLATVALGSGQGAWGTGAPNGLFNQRTKKGVGDGARGGDGRASGTITSTARVGRNHATSRNGVGAETVLTANAG